MPKYLVTIYYSASIDYEVGAENEEQAVELAKAIEEPKDKWIEKVWDSVEYEDAFAREELPADA